MARLARFVHLYDEKGELHSFGPDSDVPQWAAERITNSAAWEDGDTSQAAEPTFAGKPARNDNKDAWVEWALTADDDLDREDAEAMSKADLIEQYG